jgi:peptidoglycan/LPS O-acetylase OafA/YrhL
MSLPSQLPVFALGIVMFWAFRRLDLSSVAARRRWFGGTVAGMGVAAAVTWAAPHLADKVIALWVRVAIVLLLFALAIAQRPMCAFVNPATVHLGRISFGVYLYHFLVIHLILWDSRAWYEPRFHARLPFGLALPAVVSSSCCSPRSRIMSSRRRGNVWVVAGSGAWRVARR